MRKEDSFLETWKLVMNLLIQDGLIKNEEIENGFEISYEWLYSSLIHRNTILIAMRNVYEKKFPQNRYTLKNFKKDAMIRYVDIEQNPAIKISAGNRSIVLTDAEIETTEKWQENISSEDFMSEILRAKKIQKMYEIEELGWPKDFAKVAVETIFDERQAEIEKIGILDGLHDIAINFRSYYDYMKHEEIEAAKAKREYHQLFGGYVEPATDNRDENLPMSELVPTKERVSDIYSFQQRDEILKNLNPEKIIKYNSTDQNGAIIQGAYTCYIYAQPQQNDGYLVISEPLEGNKATRVFYTTRHDIEEMRGEKQDIDEFWKEYVRIYIEDMTGSQFRQESNTYVFNHSTDLETYKQKIQGVIQGVDKNNSKHISAARASKQLYGKEKILEAISDTRESEVSIARYMVFKIKTNEKGVRNDG